MDDEGRMSVPHQAFLILVLSFFVVDSDGFGDAFCSFSLPICRSASLSHNTISKRNLFCFQKQKEIPK